MIDTPWPADTIANTASMDPRSRRGRMLGESRCNNLAATRPPVNDVSNWSQRHGIGPNLFGVMSSRLGARPGYNYSEAMAASEQTWTPDLMDGFLAAPRDAVPGNKMMVPPVQNPAERQALIEYLATLH